jgi:hypothetical protein
MALVKYNNNSISAITSTGLTTGAMTLIKEQTASASATISFVHGTSDVVLDSTYPIYVFKFINIHPANDGSGIDFSFNGSIDTGSNYNVAKTTTSFLAQHSEGDDTDLRYETSLDLAQGTGFQPLTNYQGNDNDQASSGHLQLFNPSSTTFIKHFIATTNNVTASDYDVNLFVGGYLNTTSAIDAIQFKFASGNIDAGTIKLYGIKDS